MKLCSHKKTGQKYAAKYVRKLRGSRGVSMVDIKRELQIMNHVKGGQFLMELFDAFEDPTFVIFVVDLISGGELFEHLARMDCLTEEQTVIFTGQMLDALDSLHSANIVHLDVKPENLMLRDQKKEELVLIDFGLARQLGNGEVRCMHGTPEFVAPEVIAFDPLTSAADMWSLGVVVYIMLSGISPFLGDNDAETFSNISEEEYEFDEDYFGSLSDDSMDFLEKLLVKDQKKRMTVQDCKKHPWMINIKKRPVKTIDTARLRSFNARRKLKAAFTAVRGSVKMRRSLTKIQVPNEVKCLAGARMNSGSGQRTSTSSGSDDPFSPTK